MADLVGISEEVLRDYLEEVKTEIFVSQKNLLITASGFSKTNTKVLVRPGTDRAFLSAPRYLTSNFERVGRRAGTAPPFEELRQWVQVKGLQWRDLTTGRFLTKDQTAFLIGQKLKSTGSDIRTGKRTGIPIIQILRQNLPPAANRLAKIYAKEWIIDIKQAQK